MQVEPTPLESGNPAEVFLPKAPLVHVVAQVRFPPILSILRAESVVDFQEALRADYPHLHRDDFKNIAIGPGREPNVSDTVIWRFSDQRESKAWRVSLGTDFVALETRRYGSRDDFVARLRAVLGSVEACFRPAEAQRVGLRYINRLEGEAVRRIGELVQPSVLGVLQPDGGSTDRLRGATVHLMTQAQFMASEGVILCRWGHLPPNTTYDPDVLQAIGEPSWSLDLDMFSQQASPFESDKLVLLTKAFAKRMYSVFRLMVTDEFLRFHGGTP